MRDRRSTPHQRSLSVSRGALLVAIAIGVACDRSDQIRSALDVHHTEWTQRIAALRNRAVNLEGAFAALPPARSADLRDPARLRRWRLEASIIGARQSLADVETHLEQSVRDVEAAVALGDAAGDEALAGLVGRMDEYLSQQEQSLAASEQALIRNGEDVGP